jgi:hypothetical protein
MGGKVTYLTIPNLRGRAAVVLPGTTTDEDLEHLTALDRLNPAWVQFEGAPVTNRGVTALTRLQDLYGLAVAGSKVDDEGLKQLGAFPRLGVLNVDGTPVTDQGLKYLESLPHLESVSLCATRVTAGGIERLRKARPKLVVISHYDLVDD